MRRAGVVVSGGWRLAGAVVLMGSVWVVAAPARASSTSPPINVPCSGTGGGPAGLIAAVNQANQSGGGTIILATGCTYQLTGPSFTGANGPDGLPPITTAITMEGNGATVSGNAILATANVYRVFEVSTSGNLSAANLTIQGGQTPDPGGGLLNAGAATLTNVTIQDDETSSEGGGIANTGNLHVDGGTIGNDGLPAGFVSGGGIYNSGQATLIQTAVTGNSGATGGGIANAGQLSTSGGSVTSNVAGAAPTSHANGYGGGLYNAGGSATLASTIVASNVTTDSGGGSAVAQGGGIYDNGGNVTLVSGAVVSNYAPQGGGGIYDAGGTVTLAGAVVADNTSGADGPPGPVMDNCEPPGSVVGCVG